MPNKLRTIDSNFDFTIDEGKERVNSSREESQGKHCRKRVDEKSCETSLLCDTGWYAHKLDVPNKWNDKTQYTTHTMISTAALLSCSVSSTNECPRIK